MRRWWGGALLAVAATATAAVAGLFWLPRLIQRVEAPIVVGLIHSRTGPLGAAESAILDAEILALEELNAAGGVLGRRLEWKIADGRSDPREFGREARRLIEEEKAALLLGGLTAACRMALVEAAESADVLLIHAGSFEGMEESSSWLGVGPLPNQQAVPAVSWCVDSLKARKFFLAGIRDVSSYAVHAVVRDHLKALGKEMVGEGFVGLDGSGAAELAAAMKASGADVAISSIVGDANAALFKQVAAAGLTAEKLPIVNLRVCEDDLRRLPPEQTTGHYAAWAYFQSLEGDDNRRFVGRFQARFGADRPIGGPAASAYFAVKLWADAVSEAESTRTSELLEILPRQSLTLGDGVISLDYETVHAWRPFRVGKIRRDGQIDEVWTVGRPIRPTPFPVFRSRSAWASALAKWRATGEPGIDEPKADESASARSPGSAASPPVVWGPRGTIRASALAGASAPAATPATASATGPRAR